jgi:hypothetical protein
LYGWIGVAGIQKSPTGSFVLSGMNSRAKWTNTTLFSFNAKNTTWKQSAFPTTSEGILTNVQAGAQAGTQANCALWLDMKNETGFLVAYIYSY